MVHFLFTRRNTANWNSWFSESRTKRNILHLRKTDGIDRTTDVSYGLGLDKSWCHTRRRWLSTLVQKPVPKAHITELLFWIPLFCLECMWGTVYFPEIQFSSFPPLLSSRVCMLYPRVFTHSKSYRPLGYVFYGQGSLRDIVEAARFNRLRKHK